MSVDRGSTTLALWTRSRGAYVWPLPTGPEGGPAGPATMSTPAMGATLTGSSVTFTWYQSAAAQAYWIDAGSSQGGNNYYQSGSLPTTTLSQTVNGLPTDGSSIYVTLWTEINGQWQYNQYTYTALNAGSSKGVITMPTPGSTLTSSSQQFTWTPGSLSSAYWLTIGSVLGGNDVYNSGNLGNVTTVTVNGLPTNGQTLYVTLFSDVNGQWPYNQYTYTAASGGLLAVMQSPTPGTEIDGTSITFTWSAGAGQNYWLDVGSTPGGNDIWQSGPLGNGTLMDTVTTMPNNGEMVYVTLWTEINGQWSYNQYQYQSGPSQGKNGHKQLVPKQLVKR